MNAKITYYTPPLLSLSSYIFIFITLIKLYFISVSAKNSQFDFLLLMKNLEIIFYYTFCILVYYIFTVLTWGKIISYYDIYYIIYILFYYFY